MNNIKNIDVYQIQRQIFAFFVLLLLLVRRMHAHARINRQSRNREQI